MTDISCKNINSKGTILTFSFWICLFQPGDDQYNVVPNSKFVVSRTAFKDSSSYYRLNDKKATYKEVAVCLRSNGIDLDHNRFLILQVRALLLNSCVVHGDVDMLKLFSLDWWYEHD